MENSPDLLIVFGTVQRVMRAERAGRAKGLSVDSVPAPRVISSQCGVVLQGRSDEAAKILMMISELGFEKYSVYRKMEGIWTPWSLESSPDSCRVELTRDTAYGGCGAKLAKGVLEKILCGLPRLESEDLIVGIEFADDAGVVRVREDLGIIHTTDFFPPMVDDPYAFGRIAAANALSDVYAMGGQPLAAMNLVSFPLSNYDKNTLKEILRGGLSALKEAGALLAGGHTIEGQELLYGLAVTGTVHPDRIWKNGGAKPGDAIVLTKPLGTGLVTTAAKAGLADGKALGTAMRWMGHLNREAAELLLQLEEAPHAVTDVTGFALAGHAVEMAEASRLSIDVELPRLPKIPGALEAAASGLVPAGAAKNLESLENLLRIPKDADPYLVDLALDPQTSGGLLIALNAEDAAGFCRHLPAATIIGVAVEGPPGQVNLKHSLKGSPSQDSL